MSDALYSQHPWWGRYDDPSVRVVTADNTTNATATFQHESVGHTGNIVDMVICCLSFVGALAIILPYILNRRSRKLRHALILGLATSDLVTSIVIIVTTACLLANINLVQAQAPCTFLGYVFISSIFSQHLWNLSIALVTYMILVHPLSSFTLTVEKRVSWLWPVFWVVSLAVNAITFGLGGFGFRGGYCAFTTSFYFQSIFQFVPRAIVFTVILCLYTHLFFFLRRTNLFSKANNSNSITASRHRSAQHVQSKQTLEVQRLQQKELANTVGQPLLASTPFNENLASPLDDAGCTKQAPSLSGASSVAGHNNENTDGSRVTPVLNENDAHIVGQRRSSSLVEKDGSVEMATFEPSQRRKSISRVNDEDASIASTTAPLATYGLLDPNYSMTPRRIAPSDLDIEKANFPHCDSSSISPHSPSESSYTVGGGAATLSTKGSSAPLNGSFPRGSGESTYARRVPASKQRPFTAEEDSRRRVDSGTRSISANQDGDKNRRRASMGDARYKAADSSSSTSSSDVDSDDSDRLGNRRMRPRKDVGDFNMTSPPVEHLKHYTVPHVRNYVRMADILNMGEDELARARSGGVGGERRSSAVQILPGEVVVEMPSKEAFEEALGSDWKWGMEVTAGARASHSSQKHPRSRNKEASSRDETGLNTGTSSTSSDENGVDSIGSTLNRQASLLLLLYPSAYCLLFSISIARLAVDLANPGASVRNAHDWLHSLSRWLIFAQGAIDALIFQFVERQFRQRMKRRRRKAMGESVQESFTRRVGKKAVGQVKRSWNHTRGRSHTGSAESAMTSSKN